MNESLLEKYLKSDTRRKSSIVIIINTHKNFTKLCFIGLRFGRALKEVVENY